MILFDRLRQTVFAHKLVEDARTIEVDAIFALEIPSVLGETITAATAAAGARGSNDKGKLVCALLPPDLRFICQVVVLALLQSFFSAILGAFLYKIVIEPQNKQQQQQQQTNDGKARTTDYDRSGMAALFAFGIALPLVILGPIHAVRILEIRNVVLIMVLLLTPTVTSFRILEAVSGFAPVPSTKSLRNYVMYFSCLNGMEFDAEGNPKRVSRRFLLRRLGLLARDYVVASFLMGILKPRGFAFFGDHSVTAVDSMDRPWSEILSWTHQPLNNFLLAWLLGAVGSQGTIGTGLVYNLVYGVQTYEAFLNPMLRSRTPSDFWGRRWNLLVHNGLKNGVYKPTRKRTASKLVAVAATFLASGILHEYCNLVMFTGFGGTDGTDPTEGGGDDGDDAYRFRWEQILFFGWNGILIALEHTIGHWSIFQWTSRNLPSVLVTVLVVSSALPLAHLFMGDYIRYGYFDALAFSEFLVVCQRED